MKNDPWEHRSKGMKCISCMWFAGKVTPTTNEGEFFKIGRCRRHAPTMNGYPVVFPNDFCGDHKLDEASV